MVVIKNEIKKLISKYILLLKQDNLRISKVILFGSHAKERANRDSDIDICIISPDFGKNKVKEMSYLLKKASKINLMIEPIPLSISDWEDRDYLPIIAEIKKYGIEIAISENTDVVLA
jgi:predicted nucleotidyltransferase